MITPYNLKAGVSVIVNQNGTYGNPYVTDTKTLKGVVKKYSKGDKVGTLTGKIIVTKISGIDVSMVEVLLASPVKPNWTTTYYKLVFRATSLDVSTTKVTVTTLPKKVVKKATKTAKKRKKSAPAPVVEKPVIVPNEPYLPEDVPESTSIVPTLIIVGVICLVGFCVYKKWDYIKLKLTKKKWI
jgi:hypothetical protein